MTRPSDPPPPPAERPDDLKRQLRRMTRRGIAFGGLATLAGYGAWRWLGTAPEVGMLRSPLRRILELDEAVGRAGFRPGRMSRTYAASLAGMPRVNGRYGVDLNLDLARWRLHVEGPAGKKALTLDEVKAFPKSEVTTELRCIEGWSQVVTWGGTRLADLASASGLACRDGQPGGPLPERADLLPYAALTTPDGTYFVGLDIASALHPQTLLCYEMNGEPLTGPHGAPLRLAITVKYGIKSLKQVGTLRFGDERPADFWALKGYDWYAGL